jgi:excisionase family DNA binding protein
MDELDIFPGASADSAHAGVEGDPAGLGPLVLTIDEAAERLRIRHSLMSALVRSGEVESVRIGRLRRIPADALAAYVRALRDRATARGA